MSETTLPPISDATDIDRHRVGVASSQARISDSEIIAMAGDEDLCELAMDIAENTRPRISKAITLSLLKAPSSDVRWRMFLLLKSFK